MIPHDHKSQFPIFEHHPDLVYLDSAATSLKPKAVIDAVAEYYERYSTNVGRGLYPLAEETTARVEDVRAKTASFIHASPEEIAFTRGTTESMNLLAHALEDRVGSGDNIVVTAMEHHSNFLPWERLVRKRGAELRVIPFDESGKIEATLFGKYIDACTRIVSFTAISNVLGTINPVEEFVAEARRSNPEIITVVDAAQAAGHIPINIRKWDCDFLSFSGHKMFGPTGVGVLYGKKSLLDTLPPYQVGGGMVTDVYPDHPSDERIYPKGCSLEPEYKPVPYRFEAGTPDIAAIIGFGAAIDFIESLKEKNTPVIARESSTAAIQETGVEIIRKHEIQLVSYAIKRFREVFGKGILILGPEDPESRGGVLAFALDGIHPHDLAQILGESNICIRAGEHCAAPLHRSLDLPATARVSFSIYNDEEDIEKLIGTIEEARNLLSDF